MLDTGASHHMTSDDSQVSNVIANDCDKGVFLGNGHEILISTIGCGSFFDNNNQCFLSLSDLLHPMLQPIYSLSTSYVQITKFLLNFTLLVSMSRILL